MKSVREKHPHLPRPSHAEKWGGIFLRPFLTWIAACLFAVTWIAPVHAQLPSGCSSADQARYARYIQDAIKGLVEGNTEHYTTSMNQMESGFSKGCRTALDRHQPTRVRCTSHERELVMEQFGQMYTSLGDNYEEYLVLYEELRESITPACWSAVHRPNDPKIVKACSGAELDLSASYVLPMLRAFQHLLTTNDLSEILQLEQEVHSQRSPACNSAFAAAQPKAPSPHPGSQPRQSLPSAHDHGGGTFSVDGVGACGPTGCIAF